MVRQMPHDLRKKKEKEEEKKKKKGKEGQYGYVCGQNKNHLLCTQYCLSMLGFFSASLCSPLTSGFCGKEHMHVSEKAHYFY